MPHIPVNDIRMYYELHGSEDAPVLVLSNGILMSTASWALQLPVLSQFFRVLVYDARGMWQSDHPREPYSMDQHADDLAGLLDGLSISAAHIAGISYGGEISLVFAGKYPQKTLSLIVSSAVSHVDEPLRAAVEPWFEAARRKNSDLLFEVTAPLNFSPVWSA
ncbi:MAG TPA: alpha/beta hydrolase, partial [Anaerolineaceae bacterium]|nr:alpha/beta hydrolase [Anaerolineaceae bacterium]